MKADTFIKLLRKVVREEVQNVVREELGILLETPKSEKTITETTKSAVKNSMVESIKPVKPTQPAKPMSFTSNNVLNDILNETANGGEWRSVVDATSQMAPNFGPINGAFGGGGVAEPAVVSSVDQMLSLARPAGDVTHVKIDAVPDFSALMSTMKEKGQI
jgi:hypothetical protein